MKERRERMRARQEKLEIDALLITKPVNVRYLTGFSGSNGQLIVGPEDVFFTDPRYETQSSHEVPDCRRVVYQTSAAAIGEAGGLYGSMRDVIRELGIGRLGVEAGHMTLATARAIREKVTGVELVETNDEVENFRRIKDAGEVESIRQACATGDKGLEDLLGQLKEGQTEREVAAILEDAMRRAGSEGLSFDTIVAFGEQAAEPHHHPGERRLKKGDLIKLDFGAIHAGYHSDMTRTIAYGKPSDEMVQIYELVRGSQQAGLDAVRAGATCGEVDRASRAYLQEHGHTFGHGTGHGLGLEIHEAPPVRAGSSDVLEPGMVITVEPGIYLPGTGGVRIEDSVVVTRAGCDILTASPKTLVEV